MISKIFSLRNYVMKQIMKTTDEGIIQIPDPGKIDFGEMIIKEDLFKKGIDPKAVTSESQLDNILNTPHVAPKVKPKQSGEVIDVDFGKNWPEKKAGGGRTGSGLNYLLGEDDQNSRVPFGSGSGKPPITFTLTGGGGYGKNQNIMDQGKSIPGLNQEHYGYGFDLGTEIDLPWGLSLQGGAGIGRGSTKTDYKGQPVDWLSGVGETKLGDKWNVGVEGKWPVDFNKLFMKDGGRIGLKDGTKFDPKRRTILKGIATLAALPVIGKYFKWAKPLAKSSKVLTSVPIKDISGMPVWFKPLVNKVIKEGTDISKKASTFEREIVHRVELPGSKTKVYVTQDLNTGDVLVDIGAGKHGFAEGHLGQPVRLEYKASEVIEPTITKGKPTKATKTKEEFWVEEAEFSGGHPENVKFEDSTFEKFGQHGSDFSEVEKFATGTVKKKTGKATIKPRKVDWVDEDFASGGRVPMWMGGGLSKGKELLRNMVKYFAKNSKIGKTPSEYLKISNPKQYKKMLNDLSIYNKYHPGEGIMAPQMIKDMIKKTEGERAGVIEHIIGAARNIKKADKNVAVYKKQMVDAMVEKGADKKTAEFISDGMSKAIDVKDTPKITEEALLELETIYKNMLMKEGRQLNATGGRVPLGGGKLAKYATPEGLAKLMEKLFPGTTKLGQTSRPMAPKTELKQAIAGFQKRNTPKIWEDETKVREAVDDIFSSGDYKMDAEMASQALVENNPKAFGGKLIDDIDDATRSDIYGAVLRVVQSDLGKRLQLKKLSKPAKTLEGIEKTGTINISDPNVADEFSRFMKESDPKGFKDLEQKVELSNFDPKGRKKNAFGGLAGMLGE